MKIENADLITMNDGKYITIEVMNYEGRDYAFVNKLDEEEEPTEEFYVLSTYGNEIKKITDKELINKLLPIFQKKLEDEMKNIMNS